MTWLLVGVVGAGFVFLVVRCVSTNPALAPGILATLLGTRLLAEAVDGAYPGARLGSVLGVFVIVGLSVLWTRTLTAADPDTGTPGVG